MIEVSGTFETHLTVGAHQATELAAFAAEHDLTFLHIELDRGVQPSQPMLTLRGAGTLTQQHAVARDWCASLREAQIRPVRTKIEAAPWSTGVPQSDSEAATEPADRYFEHHIKLLLPTPSVADVLAVTDLAEAHDARLSRNARRQRPDGAQERFVNQRCQGVGRASATHRLDQLVRALRAAGHEILTVEQEYVVHDSHLDLDKGWLQPDVPVTGDWRAARENTKRTAPPGSPDYPPTYQPLPPGWDLTQRAAFDPALKQHPNAYRAGEPTFDDPAIGQRWRDARRAAMRHLLRVLAESPWAARLVLRGSVTMAAWAGDAAREPGDLDFVVTPPTIISGSAQARALLDGIIAAVVAAPGAGLRPESTAESAIWTYERADGRRLVVPFGAAGIPDGSVQIDVVFGEPLPIPPEPITLPGVSVPVLAATAGLSLAWKLQWLATDMWPQGKDLYDAVLLAEHTTVDLALTRELMRPELRDAADDFTAESVLSWNDVDWKNFTDEYPSVEGAKDAWLRRLALALDKESSPL